MNAHECPCIFTNRLCKFPRMDAVLVAEPDLREQRSHYRWRGLHFRSHARA